MFTISIIFLAKSNSKPTCRVCAVICYCRSQKAVSVVISNYPIIHSLNNNWDVY